MAGLVVPSFESMLFQEQTRRMDSDAWQSFAGIGITPAAGLAGQLGSRQSLGVGIEANLRPIQHYDPLVNNPMAKKRYNTYREELQEEISSWLKDC